MSMDFVEHTGTFVNGHRGIEELIDGEVDKTGIIAIEGLVGKSKTQKKFVKAENEVSSFFFFLLI